MKTQSIPESFFNVYGTLGNTLRLSMSEAQIIKLDNALKVRHIKNKSK